MLVVEDRTHQRLLYRGSVDPGATFVLSYVHSSEHVDVRGTFVVEGDGTFVARETAFGGFGPGLPELTGDADWRIADGMIVVRTDGPRLDELLVHVLPATRHRLRTPAGDEIDLSAAAGEGGAIRVRVEPAAARQPTGR